jgi:protein-tyrosine phosphatase
MRWRRANEPIDVLVVCTGNLCRSPIIATLLSAAVPSLTVRSAGTAAPVGRPWHPLAIEVLAEAGHHVSGTAHRLKAADVAAASLILTAEGAHRAVVVELDPSAEDRTFTLLEAARLLGASPAPQGTGPTYLAQHLTAALRTDMSEHDDDLPDPILGDVNRFRACREAASRTIAGLAPYANA